MFEHYLQKKGLSERDILEIRLARVYAREFHHGTPGHNHYMLIANLANQLEELVLITQPQFSEEPKKA